MLRNGMACVLAGTAVLLLGGHARAQQFQPPNEVDLRAAYCASALNLQERPLSDLRAKLPNGSEVAQQIDQELRVIESSRRRLKAYLVPRLAYLEPVALLAASKQADEDNAEGMQDVERANCPTSNDADFMSCKAAAGEKSAAAQRLRRCQNVSFLPF